MKKKLNFGILAIMGVVVFSACGSDSDLFDPEKAAAKKEAQYASAFVQKYGEIAVDQDWGLGQHRQRVLLTLIAINGKILRKYPRVLRLQKKKWLRNGLKHIRIHNPLVWIGPTFLFNM